MQVNTNFNNVNFGKADDNKLSGDFKKQVREKITEAKTGHSIYAQAHTLADNTDYYIRTAKQSIDENPDLAKLYLKGAIALNENTIKITKMGEDAHNKSARVITLNA